MKSSRIFRLYILGLLLGFFLMIIIGMIQSRISEAPFQAAAGGTESQQKSGADPGSIPTEASSALL